MDAESWPGLFVVGLGVLCSLLCRGVYRAFVNGYADVLGNFEIESVVANRAYFAVDASGGDYAVAGFDAFAEFLDFVLLFLLADES